MLPAVTLFAGAAPTQHVLGAIDHLGLYLLLSGRDQGAAAPGALAGALGAAEGAAEGAAGGVANGEAGSACVAAPASGAAGAVGAGSSTTFTGGAEWSIPWW
jgi:hypothetical protein